MSRYYFLFLVSISLSPIIFGQSNAYLTYPTPIDDNFDFGDGNITDIDEDWNGFIWIATTDGLFRFDGTEVYRFSDTDRNGSLPHALVYAMLIDDEDQVIWLATRGGMVRLDPNTETSTIYRSDLGDSTSLPDDLVRRVLKDRQGNIWASCFNHGLALLQEDGTTF